MRFLVLLLAVQQIFAGPIEERKLNGELFAAGINDFSVEFTKQLQYSKDNIIYSPFGLAMTSGLLLKGAAGPTKESLLRRLNMLNYTNNEEMHHFFKTLSQGYKGMSTRNENPRNATVELSNLAVTAERYSLPDHYVQALKEFYEAEVGKENFAAKSVEVTEKLNTFVKERTHGLIPKTFVEPLSPTTILVLLNTIFFKGFWMNQFDTKYVYDSTFYNFDKSEKTVKMMSRKKMMLKYAHSDKLKASLLEMPYEGKFSMITILPDEKYGLSDMISKLKYDDLESIVKTMDYEQINLDFPKLNYEYKINLLEIFPKMNVDIIPALAPLDKDLMVSSAFQKAKIQVHESGTEAAAVTVILFTKTALVFPRPPVDFKCDRPFMFFIRDMQSNANLFVGVVNKL